MTDTPTTNFSKYLAWFKSHERLVLLLAIGLFGVHFYSKGIDYLIKRDQTQVQIAQAQAQTTAAKVADDERNNQQLVAQLDKLQVSFATLSAQTAAAMQQRATQTAEQKHTDDQSAPAELAARTQKILGVGNISVSAPLGDGLTFDLAAAHANADRLEDGIQAAADVKDLTTQVASCKTLVDKQSETITSLNTTITDGKTALIAEQNSHATEVKELKLEKKKSWLNGFKWGLVTGVVGSLFVHKP